LQLGNLTNLSQQTTIVGSDHHASLKFLRKAGRSIWQHLPIRKVETCDKTLDYLHFHLPQFICIPVSQGISIHFPRSTAAPQCFSCFSCFSSRPSELLPRLQRSAGPSGWSARPRPGFDRLEKGSRIQREYREWTMTESTHSKNQKLGYNIT